MVSYSTMLTSDCQSASNERGERAVETHYASQSMLVDALMVNASLIPDSQPSLQIRDRLLKGF